MIRRHFLISGQDYHELINGHMLFKVAEDRYAVRIIPTKEVLQVLKIKDSENEDAWVIFDQKNMSYMIKPYQDFGFLKAIESGKIKEEEYCFYEIESVINHLNKLIYELV